MNIPQNLSLSICGIVHSAIESTCFNTFSARLYPKMTKKSLKKSNIPNFGLPGRF